jgi:hypothetical protein
MEFLYSTDTDGDFLIENTNVGHGWVEGGKLWGANTTFYLAGIWAQVLKDMSYITKHLQKNDLSEKYSNDFEKVLSILNSDFWNEEEQFFNYGKFADGSYNDEKTTLPAVVMYYGLLEDEKVAPILKRYSGNGFSTNWGVRILSSESVLFNPTGYHYGSVWPLFTGWTALAEYEYGNSVQGFMHIWNSMNIKNHFALGYVEEVVNGAEFKSTGVCPHQCWSETNVLHPAITGMIGWKPDAPNNSVTIKPRFPLHWDVVTVKNLTVADSKIKMRMQRSKNETIYTLVCEKGKQIKILFMPEIPLGMNIERIEINGQVSEYSKSLKRKIISHPIEYILSDTMQVTIKHQKGIGVIPLQLKPQPGDGAIGFRIISENLVGDQYSLELEGLAGLKGIFQINLFDQKIKSLEGTKKVKDNESGIMDLIVTFPQNNKNYSESKIVLEL